MANNDNSLEKAIQCVNAVITAISSIYEREVDTHREYLCAISFRTLFYSLVICFNVGLCNTKLVHVAHVAWTKHYNTATTANMALNIMTQKYGNATWHYTQGHGVDLHHALLGKDLKGGAAWIGTVCDSKWGFGVSSKIEGNTTLSGMTLWDLYIVAHEIG